ncbi:MAG: VWA domain-containing protein [Pseudomonadota bacterium]
MEEWVGKTWHRLITRASNVEYADASVVLEEIRLPATLMFRALGGDGGLRLEAATESAHRARRGFLSSLAGSNATIELAWRDEETLRLPMHIAWFPNRGLNRELYLWLAALAANAGTATRDRGAWLAWNASATAKLIETFPGLRGRYRRLLAAHLEQRPDPASLSGDEGINETNLRAVLGDPAAQRSQVRALLAARRDPAPVPLWLHPEPPLVRRVTASAGNDGDEGNASTNNARDVEADKRRRGERVDEPDGKGGLLAFRLESLFTRTEFAAVDRTETEDEDEDARSAVEDLEVLSVSRRREHKAARLRFDLDLPAADQDDARLGEGIALPEWDYRQQQLLPEHCRLQPMLARRIGDSDLPVHLRARARSLRRQFEMLRPQRVWLSAQTDGSELDTDAVVRRASELRGGAARADAGLYRACENRERSLSCLVLADLSLSTGAHVNDDQRVIDVIRDGLHLFGEALAGSGDRCALYGFSSRYRSHVRFHTLKEFDEPHGADVRGRVNAIKPGFYTRMGAALRYAARLLDKQQSVRKLLLILTDGKPNDLDRYEGRYGVEDSRAAVREAKRLGIDPFCVTIDRKAGDYLPYIFGSGSYVLVRNAAELPSRLPALYARLAS